MRKLSSFILVLTLLVSAQAYAAYQRVSVHDPSVVIGYKKSGKITGEKTAGATKTYYIFGSHKAFAKSTDMKNWATFSNNIPAQENTLFAKEIAWAALGGNQGNANGYSVGGNLWAPDVIWNKDMQKWCMYMSVNGDSWYSSIVLLTADSPEGNWTYVGPVIFSIPWKVSAADLAQHTDFYEITGVTPGTIPSRYQSNRNGNQIYGTNAIDPCVFYDEEGKLWMSYGSWFGGLWMIELDKTTGLRDKTHTYSTVGGSATNAQSDSYQGIKIYGGNHCSGEASYIEYIGDRYYLFVTYGGLDAKGGYNMRVFSSTSPTGPYTDMQGNDARFLSSKYTFGATKCPGTVNGSVGTRLMSYYKLDWKRDAFCAQGHNSVVVDDDGKVFNVYHTRFNTGNEGHQVRVHQMFQAPNGGLCTAPFEYSGETLSDKGFTVDDIVGYYGIWDHGWGTDHANLGYIAQGEIELTADGKVRGAFNGTWSLSSMQVNGKESQVVITIKRGTQTFEGVLVKQAREEGSTQVLCFTTVSKDQSLWGFKKYDHARNFSNFNAPTLPFPESAVKAVYEDANDFAAATPFADIDSNTGLSLSFYLCAPIYSDWTLMAHSTVGDYKMYLGVLHYDNSDWYEGAATPATGSGFTADNQYKAYFSQTFLVTISYNPDGTVAYYRDGKLMFTYQPDTAPSWTGKSSAIPTPKDAAAAVVRYYKNKQLAFDHGVSHITVAPSITHITTGIDSPIDNDQPSIVNGQRYNLAGQKVSADYKGIVIKNGKKVLIK